MLGAYAGIRYGDPIWGSDMGSRYGDAIVHLGSKGIPNNDDCGDRGRRMVEGAAVVVVCIADEGEESDCG